jgi:hypothetical protein
LAVDALFAWQGAGTLRRMKKQVAVTASFAEVVGLIEQARQRAYQRVNAQLVRLYWQLASLPIPSGAKAWWTAWPNTWRTRCLDSAALRDATCSG